MNVTCDELVGGGYLPPPPSARMNNPSYNYTGETLQNNSECVRIIVGCCVRGFEGQRRAQDNTPLVDEHARAKLHIGVRTMSLEVKKEKRLQSER